MSWRYSTLTLRDWKHDVVLTECMNKFSESWRRNWFLVRQMLFCGIWPFGGFPHWWSTLFLAFCHNSFNFVSISPCLSSQSPSCLFLQHTFPRIDSFTSKALLYKCCRLPNLCGQHVRLFCSRPGFLIACGFLAPQPLPMGPKLVLLPSYSPSVLFIPLVTYSLSLYSVFANGSQDLSTYPS